MKHGLVLIAAIVRHGDAARKRAADLGFVPDMLYGRSKRAWEFLDAYLKKYGAYPSADLFKQELGFELPDLPEGSALDVVAYSVDKVLEANEFRMLQSGLESAAEKLEQSNLVGARDSVHELSRELQSHASRRLSIKGVSELSELVKQSYLDAKSGVMGIPFPWDAMNDMTRGLFGGTLTFIAARPGAGKCVDADTLVYDARTGDLVRAEDFVASRRSNVLTWSEEGFKSVEVSAKVDAGTKGCVRIRFTSGQELVVTPEHKLLTPDGWVEAGRFKKGMSVAVPCTLPEPREPEVMHEDDVTLLGLFSGFMYKLARSTQFVVSKRHEWLIREVEGRIREIGGSVEYRDDDVSVYMSGEVCYLRGLLESAGILGTNKSDRVVPDQIFRLPNYDVARFIRSFLRTRSVMRDGNRIRVFAVNHRFAMGLRHLLLRLGIYSRVTRASGGSAEISIYMDDDSKPVHSRVAYPTTTGKLADEIFAWFAERGRGVPHGLLGSDKSGVKTVSMRAWERIRDGLDERPPWAWVVDGGVMWDRVEVVEDAGERRVFDFSVADTHCYVANDLVCHNTWMAANIGLNAWHQHGKKVLFVSPEMSAAELGERLAAMYSGITYADIIRGTLGDLGGEKAYFDAIDEMAKKDGFYVLDDEERMTPSGVEEAVIATDPDLVILDSIYMMRTDGGSTRSGNSRKNRYERIIEIVGWARSMSRRTNKPVLAVSQLNREARLTSADREAIEKGIGTGGLEYHLALSDVILWDVHNLFALYQSEEMQEDGRMMIVPLKMRRQATRCHVVIEWDLQRMSFNQVAVVGGSGKTYSVGMTQAPPPPSGDEFEDDFAYDEEVF